MAQREIAPGVFVEVVDVLAAPGGGEWWLGADGGIYAMGGAQFIDTPQNKDYWNNAPGGRRTARRLELSEDGYGYVVVDENENRYEYAGTAPAIETGGDVDTTNVRDGGLTPTAGERPGATAIIAQFLRSIGIPESHAADLWNQSKDLGVDAVIAEIPTQQFFKDRFPGIAAAQARREAGERGVYVPTPAEYLEFEEKSREVITHYGVPADFLDKDDIAKMVAGGVSAAELEERVVNGYWDAMNSPPEVRDQLQRLYGVGAGQLAAFFLNPDKGEKILQRQWAATNVAGQAAIARYGNLSVGEAEGLVDAGVDEGRARAGFGLLGQSGEIIDPILGDRDPGMTREQELGVIKGDVAAQTEMEKRARRRRGAFEGGGGFASGNTGVSGLGTAE